MSIGRARREAHTLIELMVASGLMMLLLGLIYEMFAAAKSYRDNCQAKISLQSAVLKGLAAINRDVAESDPNGVDCNITINAVSFVSPRGLNDGLISFDTAGRMYWKKNVCYWVAPSPKGRLTLWRRGTSLYTGNPPPLPMFPIEVPGAMPCIDLINDTSNPRRLIASNIKSLCCNMTQDGALTTNITGELRLLIHTYRVQIQGSTLVKN